MENHLPSSTQPKTICLWLLSRCLLISSLFVAHGNCAKAQVTEGISFVVAPDGSDSNPGTASQPLATLEAARDAARKALPGNHRITVMPGEYYLTRPIELDQRDNGLTIEADTSGMVVFYGGTLVTGWRRDGEKFWCADLPGVKEGTWDFRALVVQGRMPMRARMPEEGTFQHLNAFDVPWLSSIAGGWARKPTLEEATTMKYNPNDIPQTLELKNAEVRVYHMWDESLAEIVQNDIRQHIFTFSKPTNYPPGGFGKKDYIIWNTREGMTRPGQWYLDRTAGKLVYWPLAGEDMGNLKIIAPKMERIIRIAGTPEKKAENITIRGLTLQGTTIPFKSAGMGATSFDGALSMAYTNQCNIERIEIHNAGGLGISASQLTNCRITDSQIHHIGGAGAKIDGSDLLVARNHIHNVGLYYPSAVGISSNGSRNHIYRNEIHDVPYSGMLIGKNEILVEENIIYRVMKEIHDGAAIYTFGVSKCILRRNVARDIVESGTGYGVSAYYLDEGSHDCIVEKNVSIGVARPVHNHIARNSIIRDNVFINDTDMTLSFQSSAKFTFENNTLVTPGIIKITAPNAITIWKDNKIFSNSSGNKNMQQGYTINSDMPFTPVPAQKTKPIDVRPGIKAPVIDGILSADEWTGEFQRLDREPSKRSSSGAPVLMKFSRDDKFLYIGAMVTMFDTANISKGNIWGKNDGIEISIGGYDKGSPSIFVIRAYTNGTVQSVTNAGATTESANRLGKGIRYASKMMENPRKGWVGEWAIPIGAMGLKPVTDTKVAFNACAFINEYDYWHCWEGTQGESWQVDKAGILQFK